MLSLVNLPPGRGEGIPLDGRSFVLGTCQRTLILRREKRPAPQGLWGSTAYRFALETLCGLQSKIPAESEVAAQFKQAYRRYAKLPGRDARLLGLLEHLLKDGKTVRTRFLKSVGGQSYAAIVRKILLAHGDQGEVLIKGTGELAAKLIKLLPKHFAVRVTGRDRDKLARLQERHPIKVVDWDCPKRWQDCSLIVNTIGAKEILFGREFFAPWMARHRRPLYIDLGEPSVLQTSLGQADGLWRLEDVFRMGQKWQAHSRRQLMRARQAIREIAALREERLVLHHWNPGQPVGPNPGPLDCPIVAQARA